MDRRDSFTLHETENGEGNGVVHWFCSPECRDLAELTTAAEPITLAAAEVPEGSRCETCGYEWSATDRRVVRVEAGAGDKEFTPTEVSEILAGLHAAQRRIDGLAGVLWRTSPSPMQALARLLRDAVHDLPLPAGCTGNWDDFALIVHDGDTCPVHELDIESD